MAAPRLPGGGAPLAARPARPEAARHPPLAGAASFPPAAAGSVACNTSIGATCANASATLSAHDIDTAELIRLYLCELGLPNFENNF